MDFSFLFNHVQVVRDSIPLQRLIIVLVYAVLAKGTDLFIDRGLRRLTARTSIRFDDALIQHLHAPLCWTVFWLGIQHALLISPMEAPWNTTLPSLARTMILLVWLVGIFRLFNTIVKRHMTSILERGKIGNDLFLLLKNLFRVVLVVAGLLWLLAIWRIDLTPLFASAGIAGIALALAAKDTLANFFGGISIFMDNTYRVGHYIILDSGERGEVVEIGIRSTRIKTRDDVLVTIPNSIMANSKIINESAPQPRFRIRVPVGVAYGSDPTEVERILLTVAADNPGIETNPEPRVRLRAFADSSINFELLCWVRDPRDKGLETHNLLLAVYRAFNEGGITIPFPQRDIHLYQTM